MMAESVTDPPPDIAPPADSFGVQTRHQRDIVAEWREVLHNGKEQTAFWSELKKLVAGRLPAILRTLIAQVRTVRRTVSTKDLDRQIKRLHRLRRRAGRHPNVLAFRLEITNLWWRVYGERVLTIAFVIALGIILMILLALAAIYVPGWIEQLSN
jgi:hypothetical protein